MKKIISLLVVCLLAYPVLSQTNKLEKGLQKAVELAKKDKLEDADEYLVKLLKENPGYGDGWDLLARIRKVEYINSKKLDATWGGNFTVEVKDSSGKKTLGQNDSLVKEITSMMSQVRPSKIAWKKYLYTMRKALLYSEDAYECSFTLRSSYIDPAVDTNVSRKALKYFKDAEEEFEKKNYNDAANLYKRAIKEQPDFFKASLYLGDAYYFSGNYSEAIKSFKDAVKTFPNLLEPRKYLVDAYGKERLYKEAMEEAILGMMIYPDLSMRQKLEDAIYLNKKKLDIKWMSREVFPNVVKVDSSLADLYDYKDEEKTEPGAYWKFYTAALEKIKGNCSGKGIIEKASPLTKSKYLEVFSWEEMLANSKDAMLDEARRMQKEGYLDCYAFITCFHFDIYDQYSDFVSNNKSKVTEYYKKFMTEEKE